MGKVNLIKKSRKECKCDKCGKTIVVGSSYYKGEVYFGPIIRRCTDCKLESWEVSTSDYTLRAGELVNSWETHHGEPCQETIDSIVSELEDFASELQERLDNMPEGLQDGDAGMLIQERIDYLQAAQAELESIDISEIESDQLSELFDDELSEEEIEYSDFGGLPELDNGDVAILESVVAECVRDAINEALGEIPF